MKITQQRICIYPKDISMIMGKTLRSSYRLLERIRKFFRKQPYQTVSLKEFCEYTGLLIEDVLKALDQQ